MKHLFSPRAAAQIPGIPSHKEESKGQQAQYNYVLTTTRYTQHHELRSLELVINLHTYKIIVIVLSRHTCGICTYLNIRANNGSPHPHCVQYMYTVLMQQQKNCALSCSAQLHSFAVLLLLLPLLPSSFIHSFGRCRGRRRRRRRRPPYSHTHTHTHTWEEGGEGKQASI